MTMKKTRSYNKTFDCLAFKRRNQEAIREAVKDLSAREKREYYARKAESGALGDWWKGVKAKSPSDVAGQSD